MTYCVGMKMDDGIVMVSDSRTNAGLDNVSTYKKMFTYSVGDRSIIIVTSGNLSTSQHVYKALENDVNSPNPENSLNLCKNFDGQNHHPSMYGPTQHRIQHQREHSRSGGYTTRAATLDFFGNAVGQRC